VNLSSLWHRLAVVGEAVRLSLASVVFLAAWTCYWLACRTHHERETHS
jgi:hypothetical protein